MSIIPLITTIKKIQQGSLLNLKLPTAFTSSFTVDTILGQLNWTNNAGDDAQFEVYSNTNGAGDVLLATTATNATSYQDTTCKQNASVVYKIRVKKGTKFSDFVVASALVTPLCWKTNQDILTAVVINQLTITAGKSVTVNWGDGTSQAYSGSTVNITKNYGATGNYNIWLSGDTNFITDFRHFNQVKSYGNLENWNLPSSLSIIFLYNTLVSGDVSSWIFPSGLLYLYINNTKLSGDVSSWIFPSGLARIRMNATNVSGVITNWVLPTKMTETHFYENNLSGTIPQTASLNYSLSSMYLSDSNVAAFRTNTITFDISNQNVVFSTANIDKQLKALADWYQVNAPTDNCTFNLSGANMGIPTGGAANADIARLVGYYTAAAKTATVVVRTS